MSRKNEAIESVISEMKAIVDREKDASGYVSRKAAAKYFQTFVTKLENIPDSHDEEGQEMFAAENQFGEFARVFPTPIGADKYARDWDKHSPGLFKTAPVIVKRKSR